MKGILAADTITKLPAEARGAIIVSGSHGGVYPGYLAAKAGARAAIFNDAGVGKDQAGIGSLPYLQALGIAAAAVSHLSCRIGDTADMFARGTVSHANDAAVSCGIREGMGCSQAAERLTRAVLSASTPPPIAEGRHEVRQGTRRRIVLIDSAAMVRPDDAGQIIITGSHGGLVGGDPAMALRVDGFAAVYSDAGIGIEKAGTTRLPALDRRGIAAFTVAAESARIGEALSIFEEGIISVVNETARRLGAEPGARAQDVILGWSKL
jgi:hypothetical protein